MAPSLILSNNNTSNPLVLNLSNYLDLTDGSDMDPADPSFSSKVMARSLLKAGATLALESLVEKELVFPLRINASSSSALVTLIQQINQVITSPGATYSWQDSGLSQPTIFDAISGEFDIKYRYRESERFWASGDLKLFSQPLGHATGPRPYATASGIGPLLMITPYASGGALAIGASTQAGVAGFGGAPAGASTGIFYPGQPSLAGDAPALMQISYVGPLPNTATDTSVVPFTAVSILPDPLYQPLFTAPQIAAAPFVPGGASQQLVSQNTAVAGAYRQMWNSFAGPFIGAWTFTPFSSFSEAIPGGQHRLLAIARASGGGQDTAALQLQTGPLVRSGASTMLDVGCDWGLYDLGTITTRPSEPNHVSIAINVYTDNDQAVDLTALVMLPDNNTWFFNPGAISTAQYGVPSTSGGNFALGGQLPGAFFSNTLLVDNVINDQFIYAGASQQFAPSPIGSVPSAMPITQFSRGLVPAPDPKNGMPIIAILGVAQNIWRDPYFPGGSTAWPNPQNLRAMAQVNILDRVRYVLP